MEIETFLLWLESLSAAIDLAPPLDDRKLPRDLSIPRARRRRRRRGADSLETNENLVRQQHEIIRSQYPHPHLAETVPEVAGGQTSTGQLASPPDAGPPTCRPSTTLPQRNMLESLRDLGLCERSEIEPAASTRPPLSSPSGPSPEQRPVSMLSYPNPSIAADGKWKPQHQWSPTYDMIYALRCMAVLLSNAPRKTNFVIMRGRQWIIDWATGALEHCQPPSYSELETTALART